MRLIRTAVTLPGGLVTTFVIGNAVLAYIATRPRLQARLFGQNTRAALLPDALGLDYERVEYGEGLWAWWIPARRSTGNVVVVHGFGVSDEPIKIAHAPTAHAAATSTQPGTRADRVFN